MDADIQRVTSLNWQIDLETAIANGMNRLKQAEELDKLTEDQIQAERMQKWDKYNEQMRACLPEVLQPIMRSYHDLQSDPSNRLEKDYVILDGEKYGLAPIEVYLIRKTLAEQFHVDYYLIFGLAQTVTREIKYFFEIGDEWFVKDPEIERDPELALAKALKVFNAKIELEFKAKSEPTPTKEPEYIATGEDIPLGLNNDQALLTALRAIVRDEMYRPPEAPLNQA